MALHPDIVLGFCLQAPLRHWTEDQLRPYDTHADIGLYVLSLALFSSFNLSKYSLGPYRPPGIV